MGDFSKYLENKILNHILKVEDFIPPSNLYLSLCKSSVSNNDNGSTINEIDNTNGYSRATISSMSTASNLSIYNGSIIEFPESTGYWGIANHWAILDSSVYGSGNILAYGSITTPKEINSGNIVKINPNNLSISMNTGSISNYLGNKILEHSFSGSLFDNSYSIYVGVTTASLNYTSSEYHELEPSTGYSRIECNLWETASNSETSNDINVIYNDATGSWGIMEQVFLVDSESDGNLLIFGDLSINQEIYDGDILQLTSGSIDISLS